VRIALRSLVRLACLMKCKHLREPTERGHRRVQKETRL
jgi:hypothetical protein